MEYKIKRIGNGWYSFKDIPQEGRYIKIDGLNCLTDKKAITAGQKHFGKDNTYIIVD